MAAWLDQAGKNIASWWGDITGSTQKKAGQASQQEGANTLGSIAGQDAATEAQKSIAAGQAAGEQMGQENARGVTQSTMQAARTAGLNPGQAAMLGGQATGQAFTQGRQAGQQMGTNAYQTAQSQRIGAASGQAGIGGEQAAQGQQTGQDFWSGIGKLAGGISSLIPGASGVAGALTGKAKGGIVNSPVIAGEAGPEAILPLKDPDRVAQILQKLGMVKGAAEVKEMASACPTCGQPMKAKAEKPAEEKKSG